MAEPHVPESEGALDRLVAERDAQAQALFECRRFAAQLGIERQHLRDAFDTLRDEERAAARQDAAAEIAAARQERDRARAERDGLLAERDEAAAERDRARVAAQEATAMLERITSSTAWRLTGPARHLLQRVLRR